MKTPERVIAIDGPSASGKSTVARRVASALGLRYVDSGALYRGVTWLALREGVPPEDAAALERLLERADVRFGVADGAVRFTLNGTDPGLALRGADVNANVSEVAAAPAVRHRVVAWLREMRALGGLVMEGRDIGTRVFPDTPYKFYLDASPEERARRRHAEDAGRGSAASLGTVQASLQHRDRIDTSRRADPLKVAPGATVIDSTGMEIDDVVAVVCRAVGGIAPSAKEGRGP
jgi:CMP/dCMP kinase